MKLLTLVIAAGVMATLSMSSVHAQQDAKPAGPVPRMSDGKPDLSGVWWLGGDVGSRGFSAAVGRGRGAGPAPATYTDLLRPEVAAAAKKMNDNDDPTLRCMPTAFGTMNVSFMDVGAVGQIVATPKWVVMLTETYHGFKLIPTDGRAHRAEVPPSYRGDSVGRWDGDVFVVETKNFTDDTWIWAEGRVSPHSDAMRVVERYRRLDANTLQIDATIEDPKALTKPWVVPTQTLALAPFDQIMPLVCSSLEESIKDVTAPGGGRR
jgi:hypothetical protein